MMSSNLLPASLFRSSFQMKAPTEFWGVEVKVGQSLKVDPAEPLDGYIHISKVALGEAKQDRASEPVVLYLKVDDQKFVLGTLSRDDIPHLSLDLVLHKEFELSHDSKNASVYFTGYKIIRTSDDGGVSDLSDSGDDLALTDQENDPCTYLEGFETAQTLVREGKMLRLNSIDGLKGCIENLSKAIAIMEEIDISKSNLICHYLCETYSLRALCVQEDTPESEKIFKDVEAALSLWLKIYSADGSEEKEHFALPDNLTILFYNIIDLLHLKGFMRLSNNAHSLLIRIFEQKSVRTSKWLTMLWETRRLNHAFCISPINEAFVRKYSDVNLWLQYLKGSQSALIVDEVSNVANRHETDRHSIFVSAYIYIDLSRRLVSNGRIVEALFNAKKANNLFVDAFASSLSEAKALVSKEIEVCLSNCEAKDFEDSYLTPWKTMQGFLEGVLQLGIIYEMMGDGKNSEKYLRFGKKISKLFHSSLFMVAFSTILGKLYAGGCTPYYFGCSAPNELEYARKSFEDSKESLGCSKCKSVLSFTLHELLGDEPRTEYVIAPAAKERYKKAFDEIYSNEWKNQLSCPTGGNDGIAVDTEHAVGKRCACSIQQEMKCWHCLPYEVIKSGSLNNFIDLKWEFVRRQLSLELQARLVKYTDQSDEACKILLKGISTFVGRNFLHTLNSIPKNGFSRWVAVEIPGDMFAIERAKLIYDICWYSLKYYNCSEFTSKIFGNLSSDKFADMVSWLRVAFVLSREVPVIFQKVSRLLALMYVVSCSINQLPLASASDDLGENYWSAYFHQASIGAYFTYMFHSDLTERFKGQCVIGSSSIKQDAFDSLGLVPKATKDLSKHMKKVLIGHPAATITSISILGWDYTTLLRELPIFPRLPEHVRAVMLISRLSFESEPVVILFPLDSISQVGSNLIDKYEKPNGDSVVDNIIPVFRTIIEDAMFDAQQKSNLGWKYHLDECLGRLLSNLEDSWFDSWKCLLLGERLNTKSFDPVLESFENNGRSVCKLTKDLLKIILGGEEKTSVSKLSSNARCYIAKIGYDAWRSILLNAADEFEQTLQVLEVNDSLNRKPVILVLDYEIQLLPWENLPIARKQEMYRMPSVSSIFAVLDKGSNHEQVGMNVVPFPSIDPREAYYVLNPDGQIDVEFEKLEEIFKSLGLKGKTHSVPTAKEIVSALENFDLFMYFGHGDGTQYIDLKEIEKLDKCAAGFVMGCSSGVFILQGNYAPLHPPAISYMLAGSPAIVSHLWTVTAPEVDKFSAALFEALLKQRSDPHKRRIGAFMPHARKACTRPLLTGGSAICYGVPTEICKKKESPCPRKRKRNTFGFDP